MKTYSRVTVGTKNINRIEKLQLIYHRYAPLTSCVATVQDTDGALYKSIQKEYPIIIEMGYRLGVALKWTGTLREYEMNDGKLRLYCVGVDQVFEREISQVWMNETPENIVRQLNTYTGFESGKILQTGITIPKFVVRTQALWQAERMLEKTMESFGLDTARLAYWIGADSRINWGTHDEPGEVEIVSGENLVAYSRNKVIATLTPNLRESQRVHVIAPGIDAIYRAERVTHEISYVARTYIYLEAIDG